MAATEVPYKVGNNKTTRLFKNCPRCNSINTYTFTIEEHDNPDSGNIICNDCGYNT